MNKLLVIKIETEFDFRPYLYMFPNHIQIQILAPYHYKDKVIAFTSALLKYHYLPTLLNTKAAEMKLSNYGKPYFTNHHNFDFNISHSGEYVVIAVTENGKIGVDIELIDQEIDLSLGTVVFTQSEYNYIDTYLDFFILWTKKEAYLKCIGTGFMEEPSLNTAFSNYLDEVFDGHQLQSMIFDKNYLLSVCSSK